MFRLLIRLAIAALIANALWRLGSEYVTYYKFKDEVRNAATFRKGTDDDLRDRIEALAANYGVPLDDEALRILSDESRGVDRSVVDVSYVKPIEFFPGYEYPWTFSFSVDTIYSKRF